MKNNHPFTLLTLCGVLGLSALLAPRARANEAPSGSFAIVDVRVFDGLRVLPEATVVVQDDLIAVVGSDAVIPDGLPVVDGTGATLLPGLIDSHTHSWDTALERTLVFGVTTHLDMFTATDWADSKRKEQ
ncbi:MAG: hypothetical protein K8J08_05770, partial [Thermoanaerobaculia bacterium]|nr:hypothetical protein [Thermoanaerobaculia bacterium]